MKYTDDFFVLYDYSRIFNKSTLLIGDDYVGTGAIIRLIGKIDKPISGSILIDNKDITLIKNRELNLAIIPDEPIFINNNLFKNLYYPLKIRKINKNIAKNIINNAISHYKIENFNKKINKLNISQRKIIALLRAKIRQPKYILIDNLFDNFDNKYLDILQAILLDMSKESIIIATEKVKNNTYENLNFEIINLYQKDDAIQHRLFLVFVLYFG
ncbi:MAG: ATP-binding cassette domain-containing protein [Clostridia bacterium]|nr:ATP-binding cassette domain-containing protein [Clostridia bacterium]